MRKIQMFAQESEENKQYLDMFIERYKSHPKTYAEFIGFVEETKDVKRVDDMLKQRGHLITDDEYVNGDYGFAKERHKDQEHSLVYPTRTSDFKSYLADRRLRDAENMHTGVYAYTGTKGPFKKEDPEDRTPWTKKRMRQGDGSDKG
jgi:hypothetical protein